MSSNADQLKLVIRQLGERVLVPSGFKQRGRDFYRAIEPGFTHIIAFGLGPGWSTEHGKFTVDVCVFIEEVYETLRSQAAPKRPTDHDCELRMRLGLLDKPPLDKWWPVSSPLDEIVTDVEKDIYRLALPFLSRLSGRRSFVEEWREHGDEALGLSPRGILVTAIVLKYLGDEDGAQHLLRVARLESMGQRWEEFYREIIKKLGGATDAI
jgi:hypothetical protein